MPDPEARILAYPGLPPDEQRAVEAFVADHPAWQPLFADVQALTEALADAQRLHAAADDADDADGAPPNDAGPSFSDHLLAYYVTAEALGTAPQSAALRAAFDRLAARLAEDAALRARADALRARLDAATSAFDPVAHFEALSGHRLDDDGDGDEGDRDEGDRDDANGAGTSSGRPASGGGSRPSRVVADRVAAGRVAADRVADRSAQPSTAMAGLRRLGGPWRVAVRAALVLAVAYGALWLGGRWTQGEVQRLAAVDVSETVIEGYETRTRSAAPPATAEARSPDALFLEALQHLRRARVTTLGLFPRYDDARLARAEALLAAVVKREAQGSFLQLEARFFLGKVHLAQGDAEAARPHLKAVAAEEGRRAEEATRLLLQLQDAAPAETPAGYDEEALPSAE